MSLRVGLIRIGRATLTPCSLAHSSNGHRTVASGMNLSRRTSFVAHNTVDAVHLDSHVERLATSIALKNVSEIHTDYNAVMKELSRTTQDSSTPSSPLVSRKQLLRMLDVLASSARPPDIQLMERILADMGLIFSWEPRADVHDMIVESLVRSGNTEAILHWLQEMPRKPGCVMPSRQQWHLLFDHCAEVGDLGNIHRAIRKMKYSGCKPNSETFGIVFKAYFNHLTDPASLLSVFTSAIDQMKREGLYLDPTISDLLYNGFARRKLFIQAAQIQAIYKSRFPNAPSSSVIPKWQGQLSAEAIKSGTRAALRLFRTLEKKGCVASPDMMRAILRGSRNRADIQYLEKELGVPGGPAAWSVVMGNILRTGDTASAVSLYHESRDAGIIPDAAMVGPLIGSLCHNNMRHRFNQANVQLALDIYRDLIKVAPLREPVKTDYRQHAAGPDSDIYESLFRAFASHPDPGLYVLTLRSLLDDMLARGISMNSSTTASTIILLIKNASTAAEAFQVYRHLHRSLEASGYNAVLHAFGRLTFKDDVRLPSVPHYFQIVKDMQKAGYAVTIEVYTTLLEQFGKAAEGLTPEDINPPLDEDGFRPSDFSQSSTFLDKLVKAIRRMHDILTLDASVSPDAAVWNQLMDTYQRVGCFGDAYRVWETMYLSGRFNHTSVSIIFDACGFAGSWHAAKHICARLLRDDFKLNQNNWNSWIECLCRLGRLDDAVKTVCLEMGKHQEDVRPDLDTFRLLVTFGRKYGQEGNVKSHLRRHLPQLWTQFQYDLK